MDHQKGTGTHGRVDSSPQGTGSSLVPVLVPTSDNSCIYRSTGDKTPSAHHTDQGQTRTHVSTGAVKRKTPLTRTVNGVRKSGREDLNLRPPDPQSGGIEFEADVNTQPINTDTDACTNACTSETHLEHADNNEHNFSQALAMIAKLPLTYDEKAKAVRRLLAQDKAE